MTPEERNAFTERIAIMEFDGKLSHREAVLAAFKCCFPDDYEECVRIAAEAPDGENTLYEFLESLLKKPIQEQKTISPLRGFDKLEEYAKGSV